MKIANPTFAKESAGISAFSGACRANTATIRHPQEIASPVATRMCA
jgi:hypothetical protein